MIKFKNLKIEINDQQPLDEVVRELRRLGYREVTEVFPSIDKYIVAYDYGGYGGFAFSYADGISRVTLTELKEME